MTLGWTCGSRGRQAGMGVQGGAGEGRHPSAGQGEARVGRHPWPDKGEQGKASGSVLHKW